MNRRLASAEVLLESAAQHSLIPQSRADELQNTIAFLRHRSFAALKLQRNDPPMWDQLSRLENQISKLSSTNRHIVSKQHIVPSQVICVHCDVRLAAYVLSHCMDHCSK